MIIKCRQTKKYLNYIEITGKNGIKYSKSIVYTEKLY